MIRTLPNSNSDVLKPVTKRLQAGKTVCAEFYDTNTLKQQYWRIVSVTRHEHGEVTIRGINPDEKVRLHLSRVSFTY